MRGGLNQRMSGENENGRTAGVGWDVDLSFLDVPFGGHVDWDDEVLYW